MKTIHLRYPGLTLLILWSLGLAGCTSSANSRFWGRTTAPTDNILRYVTGSEPESLDPQIGTGQPEARIYMALYDALVEYDPKTMQPIPSIAERWEISEDGTEYLFHLRNTAKFSDGKPITAKDFVYSFRRGFEPELAARNASLGYYIKYAEAFNSHASFLKRDGKFVFASEIAEAETPKVELKPFGPDTEFRRYVKGESRLVLSSDLLARAREIEKNPKLKELFKFDAKNIKDATALSAKINTGTNGITQLLKSQVEANALTACAKTETCTDESKKKIADAFNKLSEGDSLAKTEVEISDDTKSLIAQLDKENKKRADDNAKIDEEIAKIEDAAKKEEKAKTKKQPLAKLFYVNRSIIQDVFKDELLAPEIVPVKGEDIGVEAIDDYTFRLTLSQPAPYFLGLLAHQFFRVLPQQTIEKYGKNWSRPENIVTSGAFKVKEYAPYHQLIVEKDPNFWDAKTVKLAGIAFYPSEENTTILNLYKAGSVDAFYNHTVPATWVPEMRNYKDEYLDHPEVAIATYSINITRPPMNNIKVREAFNLAFDRESYAVYKKTAKPLYTFSPEGIFPEYEAAKEKVAAEIAKEKGISLEEYKNKRKLNVPRACQLFKEAGYKVTNGENGKCKVADFPEISITYNTQESNKTTAEFIQAQWKQNVGIEVALKNMEWKTFLPQLKTLEYTGFGRKDWVGDYMDPYTFLELHVSSGSNGNTGWQDPKYDKMLDEANTTVDIQKRNELLARAEFYMLDQFICLPIAIPATNWMKKPYVKGLYPNPGTLHAWKYVYIEQDPAKWDSNVDNLMKDGFDATKAE